MKKKYYFLVLAVALVAVSIVGGSLAAASATGSQVTSELASPTLRLSVGSSASGQQTVTGNGATVMPGDTLGGTDFTISNTGELPFYLRVTVTKFWTDKGSNKLMDEVDAGLIHMTAGNGWLQAAGGLKGNSGETEVYYCSLPVQPGASVPMAVSLVLDKDMPNEYSGLGISVQITADSVQYVSGYNELNASGILASFGVKATLNADGSILSLAQ